MKRCFTTARHLFLPVRKRMYWFTVGVLLLSCLTTHGQLTLPQTPPPIKWQKMLGGTLDDFANTIIPTSDGGYLVGGTIASKDGNITGWHGGKDIWVVKLDADGHLLWQRALGGSKDDKGTILRETAAGYVVAGLTNSNNGDVKGNHGSWDIWLVILDPVNGNPLRKYTYGGTQDEDLASLVIAASGEMFLGGTTSSSNGNVTGSYGGQDFWVLKLRVDGSLIWQKALGGTGEEKVQQLQVTANGDCIVAGTTSSSNGEVTGFHGTTDLWIVKLAGATGEPIWKRSLGGSGEEYKITIHVVKNSAGDEEYLAGCNSNSADGDVTDNRGFFDIWIARLNYGGDVLWTRNIGGESSEPIRGLLPTKDNGCLVAGYANSWNVPGLDPNKKVWLIKLDEHGTLQWQNSYGDGFLTFMRQTEDLGYVFTTVARATGGGLSAIHGKADIWLVKLTPTGEIQWERSCGGSDDETFGSEDNTYYRANWSGYTLYENKPIGSVHTDYQLQDGAGNYILAVTSRSNDGDVSGLHYSSRNGIRWDFWVVKLGPDGSTNTLVTTTAVSKSESIAPTLSARAYPNPFTAQARLEFTAKETGSLSVELYNSTGALVRTVFQGQVKEGQTYSATIRDAALPKGGYIYKISNGRATQRGTLIKQ